LIEDVICASDGATKETNGQVSLEVVLAVCVGGMGMGGRNCDMSYETLFGALKMEMQSVNFETPTELQFDLDPTTFGPRRRFSKHYLSPPLRNYSSNCTSPLLCLLHTYLQK
jgi:hypothetical protein